ncbi:transferrin isoform X2 [Anoplolepis gracilipes]
MAPNPRSIIVFRMFHWFIFTLVIFGNIHGSVNINNKWRLCVVKTEHNSKRIISLCTKLTDETPIACVIETDRFGCIHRIIKGDVDFTVLEPEELVAVKNYYLYKVLVINELKLIQHEAESFQIVAIAHKNVQRIWDIQGKRLCHPGFNNMDTVFSTYLENLLIHKECDSNMTLFENRIHALSKFFEMACIAGLWSSDAIFDYQLKSKYKNLCAACENPSSCYNTDKYYGRQGALLCLTDNVGDVAWVRLDDARVHFKAEMIDTQDYKFLCPDGTTKPLKFDEPCGWISKPWPVVIATMKSAAMIARTINSNTTNCWKNNLLQLMESYYITLTNVDTLEVPSDYLSRFPNFMSAYDRSGCRPSREVRWCVVSNLEWNKCDSLRAASIVYGVEPGIYCFQEKSREFCLKAIQNNLMDIFLAQPEELLEARLKGLKPIVHAMSNTKEEVNRIVAVVKVNSVFMTIKDLKGATAAFTNYRSIGWNAFVTLIRNMSAENWDCSDAQVVANFFKNSCVLNSKSNKELPANLHSLCKKDMKQANDDLEAFDYLTSNIVDVAFVNLKNIKSKIEAGDFYHEKIDHRNINRKPKYRILGPSIDTLQGIPYLLAWTTLGSIVSNENITDLRRQEIYSVLFEMDKLFGKKHNGQTPAFLLYGPYNGNRSIIFPDDTRHLELHGRQVLRGRNYDEIVEEFMNQEVCSAASTWLSHFLVSFSLNIIVVIILS